MLGFLIALAALAGFVAWTAKIAESRGRFALGWAAASVVVGAGAFIIGLELIGVALTHDTSDLLAMIAVFMPVVLMIGSMRVVMLVLQRLPIKTSSWFHWPVDSLNAGAESESGRLAIETAALRIELPSGARIVQLTALRTAQADGECVRLSWEADGETRELMLLPRGTPDTPEGRRQQSHVLSQRLCERISVRG
jgi:hypothetical protein